MTVSLVKNDLVASPYPAKADKEMLASKGGDPKHATYRFHFQSGLDVRSAYICWEALLESNWAYDGLHYNCHMPVAEALISASKGINSRDKPIKKTVKFSNSDQSFIPITKNQAAWSVAKMAQMMAEFEFSTELFDFNPRQ